MQQTQYYSFLKPEATDDVTPDPFNTNADAIDLALHNLSEDKQDALSTSQMNALNSGMTTAKREKLDALPTASELNTTFNGKQNTLTAAQSNAVNSGITSAKVAKLDALPTSTQLDGSLSTKANKSDITNISITGTTNNAGSTILAGTRFYLNGELCTATKLIPNGATFTTSNYQQVPIHNGKVYIKLSTGNVPSTTDFSVALSVTIPADCEFALYGVGFFNKSPCAGAKFREGDPNSSWAETASTGNRVSISGVNYGTDTTFYLLTKYGDTAANDKQIRGWYKRIDYNVKNVVQ